MSKYPKIIINDGKIKCFHCKKEKELIFFQKQNHTSIGYRGVCKKCCLEKHNKKKYGLKYYYSVKDSQEFQEQVIIKNKKQWEKIKNDPEKLKKEKERRTSWYHKTKNIRNQNPKTIYNTYYYSAKKTNRDFLISYEDFIIFFGDKECYYCGDILQKIGIDRLDNNIGYILSNCVPCCRMCNWMKRSFPEKDFISKCNQISKKHQI